MGYKDEIKTILRDIWGIQDRYFECNLCVRDNQEQLRDFNAQTVKARLAFSRLFKYNETALIDMYITVWGSIKYEFVYNKISKTHQYYLHKFIQAIVTELQHDIKTELEQYKESLKKSA